MNYLKKIFEKQTKPIVKLENDEYKLSSKYKIGKIKLSKNLAILDLLDNKSQKIFIEHENLNGAYEDDIVLVQVIFNPKGKTKAKVLEVLEREISNVLCIVKDSNLFTVKENIFIDCDIVNNRDGDIVIFDGKKYLKYLEIFLMLKLMKKYLYFF